MEVGIGLEMIGMCSLVNLVNLVNFLQKRNINTTISLFQRIKITHTILSHNRHPHPPTQHIKMNKKKIQYGIGKNNRIILCNTTNFQVYSLFVFLFSFSFHFIRMLYYTILCTAATGFLYFVAQLGERVSLGRGHGRCDSYFSSFACHILSPSHIQHYRQ